MNLNEAQDSEKSSDLSMGERAISQLLREKLDNEELVSVITNELNDSCCFLYQRL